MADDIGINIKAYDNASGVLGRVSGKMGMLSKQGVAMGVGFGITHMALQAVMQAFQMLKQYITDGVKSYREFEDAMAEVDTMLQGTTEKYLPEMQTAIEDLSVQWGKSANDMARGMYQVLSASVDAGQAISVLEVAATAAVAGITSVETAVDSITTVLNAYGEGASRASHISDVMFKTVQRGKLRFEEMSASMAYTVSIASKAGIVFEEVAAAMATMTKQGIKANMAARGLRMVIADILSPSEEATKAAAEYGIRLGGLHLRVVGLGGIITELTDALGTNAAAYAKIFPNVQSMSAVLALATQDAKMYKDDIKAMFEEAGGASAQAALEIVESGGFMAKATEQTIEKQKRELGEGWSDIVDGAQKTGATVVNAFGGIAMGLGALGSIVTLNPEKLEEYRQGWDDLAVATDDLWNIDKQVAATKAQLIKEWYKGIQAAKSEEGQYRQNVAGMIAYTEANDVLNSALEMTENELTANADAMDEAAIAMNENSTAFYEASDYIDGLNKKLIEFKATLILTKSTISDLNTQIDDLKDKIAKVEAIQSAQNALKNLEKQYDALEKASWRYGMTNKKLSLEMMQIELAAMGRRGRYTRTEKKQMEDIRKEQLKNRIEQAKIGIETDYFEADELAPAREKLAEMRNIEDQELDLLRGALSDKIEERNGYIEDLKITYADEKKAFKDLIEAKKILYNEYRNLGVKPPPEVTKSLKQSIYDVVTATNMSGREKYDYLRSLATGTAQTGISKVGQTGLYEVHEGEEIRTKGAVNAGIGSGRVTIDLSGNLNVNVTKTIGAGDDPEAWVAKKISDGVRRGLITTDIDTLYG